MATTSSTTTTTAAPAETTTEAPPPETTTTAAAETTTETPATTTSAAAGAEPSIDEVTYAIDPDDGAAHNAHSVQISTDAKLTITWSTQNATAVRIDPLAGPFDASGSTELESKDANYSIVALGDGGAESQPYALEVHTHDPSEVVSSHTDATSGDGHKIGTVTVTIPGDGDASVTYTCEATQAGAMADTATLTLAITAPATTTTAPATTTTIPAWDPGDSSVVLCDADGNPIEDSSGSSGTERAS
jgi:hypothetical protein